MLIQRQFIAFGIKKLFRPILQKPRIWIYRKTVFIEGLGVQGVDLMAKFVEFGPGVAGLDWLAVNVEKLVFWYWISTFIVFWDFWTGLYWISRFIE